MRDVEELIRRCENPEEMGVYEVAYKVLSMYNEIISNLVEPIATEEDAVRAKEWMKDRDDLTDTTPTNIWAGDIYEGSLTSRVSVEMCTGRKPFQAIVDFYFDRANEIGKQTQDYAVEDVLEYQQDTGIDRRYREACTYALFKSLVLTRTRDFEISVRTQHEMDDFGKNDIFVDSNGCGYVRIDDNKWSGPLDNSYLAIAEWGRRKTQGLPEA